MCRFLQIAYGSATELEYDLLLARDLQILEDETFQLMTHQADEVERMLTALIQSVRPALAKRIPPSGELASVDGSGPQLAARSSRLSGQ